jgi:predicted DNA-binding protein
MTRLTLRLPDELHGKLRWLSYKESRSQQLIVVELLEEALKKVKVPEEGKK